MGTLPGPAGDSWGEENNARRYDAHAHEYPSYRETSRDLVALALPLAAAAAVSTWPAEPGPRSGRPWPCSAQAAG